MRHSLVLLTDVARADQKGSGLRNFTLSIDRGEILGLFGHRYAGKTALFQVLAGVAEPERGQVSFFDTQGREIKDAEERPPCVLLERQSLLIGEMTVGENLMTLWNRQKWKKAFLLGGRELRRLRILLADFHLNVSLEEKASRLTMMQRLMVSILAAKMRGIRLLLIDGSEIEGSDAEFAQLSALIRLIREEGMTFVIFSPRIRAMTLLCDRIAFLRRGRILKIVMRGPNYEAEVNQILDVVYRLDRRSLPPPQEMTASRLQIPYETDRERIMLEVGRGELLLAESADPAAFFRLRQSCAGRGGFESIDLAELDGIQTEMTPVENLCMGLYPRLSDAMLLRKRRAASLQASFLSWYGEPMKMDRADSVHLVRKERIALNFYRYLVKRPVCLLCYDLYLHNDPVACAFVRRALLDLMKEGTAVILVTSNRQEWKDLASHNITI